MIEPSGIVGTPVTPFDEDNEVDVPTLERLVDFLIRTGVDFLGMTMHIGESLNLSIQERNRVVEVAVKTAAGRVPVLVNVSLPGTDHVVGLARDSEARGASGVIVITPYYWTPPREALLEHFMAVGNAVEVGLMTYNFPAKLGIEIPADLVVEMIDRLPNFVGVKDASFDMEYFTELCRVSSDRRPGFAVMTGIEYLLPSMAVGGAGSFSACGAVAPNLVRQLFNATANGEIETARGLQFRLSRLWNAIRVDYPAGIKAAMDIMGRPVGQARRPIPPLSSQGRARLRKELEISGIVDTEPAGW